MADRSRPAGAPRQLEATWLRTAMDRWADFAVVTREALDVACAEFGVDPDPGACEAARRDFLELPPRVGAVEGLADLAGAGLPLGVLSNGSSDMIEASVRSARLDDRFEALLSADAASVFKPHPAVAVERFALAPDRICDRERLGRGGRCGAWLCRRLVTPAWRHPAGGPGVSPARGLVGDRVGAARSRLTSARSEDRLTPGRKNLPGRE